MSLLSDLIARLRAAIAHTGEAATGVNRARDQLEQAATAARAVTDGSSNPLPAEGDAQLQAAIAKADEAAALIAAGSDTLERYITGPLLGGGAGGGGAPPGPPPTPAPPPDPPWAGRPAIPGFTHRKPVREAVDAVRREGWPRNTEGRISARGFLYTGDGRQVNAEVFRPRRRGQAPPCEDLREPWRSDERYTTTWHAERDAAELIRQYRISNPVLYLNIPTCGKQSADHLRCDANLEKILPAGTEMYVWTIHEDGSRSRRRYVGTGEAIND
jgi:hypothetical protein